MMCTTMARACQAHTHRSLAGRLPVVLGANFQVGGASSSHSAPRGICTRPALHALPALSGYAAFRVRKGEQSPVLFHGSVRGAKILRWECDTKLAREMATISDAADFLCFCLEREEEFTKRDWVAALTLLTVRKRFSTQLPLFKRFADRLLHHAESKFEESVHLLVHRFGVISYAPAVWHLLPLISARLPVMQPKQIALCAWSMGRALVNDDDAWTILGGVLRTRAPEFAIPELAMMAWSFAAIDRHAPLEIVAVKDAARRKLMGTSTEDVCSHDLCMLFKAVAKLTPHDRRFLEWLLLLMLEGMARKVTPFTAQSLTSVWSTLGSLKWQLEAEALEALCEESRLLRLDHTFNQDMAAAVATALLSLEVTDQRPEYPVVDFVARKGLNLRADTLLTLAEFMALRGVSHDVAWKRIGVRAQQRGMDLKLPDLDRLVNAFRRAGRMNDRIHGMLLLARRLREDQVMYGAA